MNLRTLPLDTEALQLTAEYAASTREPQSLEFAARFSTREAADEFAARFPKTTKLHTAKLWGGGGDVTYLVTATTRLSSDRVNGGVNETGVRRYWSTIRAAARLGVEVTFDGDVYVNSYRSREQLEAAL